MKKYSFSLSKVLRVRKIQEEQAAARVSALEHLDERGRVAHTVERRRDKAKTADDIVNTRGHHQPPPERTRWERP